MIDLEKVQQLKDKLDRVEVVEQALTEMLADPKLETPNPAVDKAGDDDLVKLAKRKREEDKKVRDKADTKVK